ncbi:MAG: DUF5799 family protein [Halobacteriaceae archaeon]
MSDWQDRLASHRLRADREFEERVRDAELSRRQWDLAMTAVTFRVENPDDPDEAELVADTSNLDDVVSEMHAVGQADNEGGSVLDDVKSALGLGDDGEDPLKREAERLVVDYADELEEILERENAWEDIRRAAAAED